MQPKLWVPILISTPKTNESAALVPLLASQITKTHTLWLLPIKRSVVNSSGQYRRYENRNEAAIVSVDTDMLQHIWLKTKYRLDIVHVTNGAIIEYV